MKKIKLILSVLLVSITLLSCGGNSKNFIQRSTDEKGLVHIYSPDLEDGISVNNKVDGSENVIILDGAKIKGQNIAAIAIGEYAGRMATYKISGSIKIENSGDAKDCKTSWVINDLKKGQTLPTFFDKKIEFGKWTDFSGEITEIVSENKSIVLNLVGAKKSNVKVYLKDFSVEIECEEAITGFQNEPWLEAPSLKEKYDGIFDYIGLALGYNNELNSMDVQEGIDRHFSSITMGNEFKPDFIFNWQRVSSTEDFKAEDGKIYQVPANMPSFGNMSMILMIAQDLGIKMRGHVLVWHSQTPEWFFKENYSADLDAKYVDKATMTAREEWYIKTVLNHVKEWEDTYNDGERIVEIWDVVNEAVSDSAGSNKWLREDSSWYRVFGDETFIINAFRYANKYAPADVKLVYNDYNTYQPGKRTAICNLVDEIRSYPDARIDAVGMQSHVSVDFPAITGKDSFEEAVQKFVEKGIDVQVTELDVANGKNKYSPMGLKNIYKEYFKVFIRNRKTEDKNGIMGVTIWGITDGGTWLDNLDMYRGFKQYPLLLNEDFTCKPAFYGVLEAADSIGN